MPHMAAATAATCLRTAIYRLTAVCQEITDTAKMTDFRQLVQLRRSHRTFTPEEIDGDQLELILRATLMSPTSKGRREWQFVAIDDKPTLEKLADCKEHGASFIKEAPVAIAVCGMPAEDDCWIEDGSIAAISMQYQAEELGLGSCWIQIRSRGMADGTPAASVVRGILALPDDVDVLCIIAIGHKASARKPQDETGLKWENVHINRYR